MNFLIAGGTGFIGKHLTNELTAQGHHVYIVTRTPNSENNTEQLTYISYEVNPGELPPIYGIINLAGESLFGYWTTSKKEAIGKSRNETTKQLVQLVKALKEKPKVWINGSAVGYYGTSTDVIFTENTTKPGNDFLSTVVVDWETTAKEVETLGIRTVYARFGMVLDNREGSFPLMVLPVRFYIGGKIGDGEQWISWVHVKDAVGLLTFCLFNEEIAGPVNITAPHPKRNKDFYQILAKVYHRPLWVPIPAMFIRLAMGEMATLITEGQFVYPQKAKDYGYTFLYPELDKALKALK